MRLPRNCCGQPEREPTAIASQPVEPRPASAPVSAGFSVLRHAEAEVAWAAGPPPSSGAEAVEEVAQTRSEPEAAEVSAVQATVALLPATKAAERLAAEGFPEKEAGVARQAAAVARRPVAEESPAWRAEVAPRQVTTEAAPRLAVSQGLEAAARPEPGRRLELAEARIGRAASPVPPGAPVLRRAELQARCRRLLPWAVRPAGRPGRPAKARRREARSRRRSQEGEARAGGAAAARRPDRPEW